MLQALQRPRAAAEVLLRSLVITPHLVRGHALLADALRDMGLKREAVECMKTVLALEPGNLEALSHLSFEKRHVGDWSELELDTANLEQALGEGPATRPRVAGHLRLALAAAFAAAAPACRTRRGAGAGARRAAAGAAIRPF